MDSTTNSETHEVRAVRPTPVPEDEYFTGYANGASIAHTYFDFQLHFSELKVRGPESVQAETFATIFMSPQHAKALLRHLAVNLELYESKFGEIRVPDNIATAVNEDIPLRTESGESI